MKVPVALQLYSVREECEKDFVGTLEKVAQMGYEGVEFAGYFGLTAEELKGHLDRLGLKACGSHVGIDLLKNNLDEVIEYNKKIGAEYIICPWAKIDSENNLQELIKLLTVCGQKCKNKGISFGYHNHYQEFKIFNEEYALDTIYKSIPEDILKAEIDVYWVQYAGVDPIEYIKKYKERLNLIHFKDMKDKESKECSVVGEGIIDFKAIKDLAAEFNTKWFVVEDESTVDELKRVEQALKNLRQLGI